MASGKASPHASCMGPLGIPLPSMLGPKTLCRVGAGTGGFHSSADMVPGVLLESPYNNAVQHISVWSTHGHLDLEAFSNSDSMLLAEVVFCSSIRRNLIFGCLFVTLQLLLFTI